MKSQKVSKKAKKVAKAISNLLVAVLDEPKVKRVLSFALGVYLLIGFVGLALCVAFLFFAPFGRSGYADWFYRFATGNLWLSIPWLIISVSTGYFIAQLFRDLEPKNQTTPNV
jgi:hypothetical protein